MNNRLLPAAALASVAVAAGLIGTAGSAGAAAPLGHQQAHLNPAETVIIDPDGRAHRNHSSTTTEVRSSGNGGTAVTSAGGPTGSASQYADQRKPDTSTHSSYEDNSRSFSRTTSDSHNSSSYHDSHNTTEVDRRWGP
jgi:hypothetical protein